MKIVIYGRPGCPYCVKAHDLCQAKALDFEYIDYKDVGLEKADLEKIVGKLITTVPQILVDGVPIGGFTELQQYLLDLQSEDPLDTDDLGGI